MTTKKFTDDGQRHDKRGLKQRDPDAVRIVPIPPSLVRMLRAHIKEFGVTQDGRLFRNERDGIIGSTGHSQPTARQYSAGPQVLTESPPGRRPFPRGAAPVRPGHRGIAGTPRGSPRVAAAAALRRRYPHRHHHPPTDTYSRNARSSQLHATAIVMQVPHYACHSGIAPHVRSRLASHA